MNALDDTHFDGEKKGNPKKNSRSHIEISENRNNVTKQSLCKKNTIFRGPVCVKVFHAFFLMLYAK